MTDGDEEPEPDESPAADAASGAAGAGSEGDDAATTGGGGGDDAATDSGGDVIRGDRFSGGPARGFLSSLAADERLFAADVAVDRAHIVMLAEHDILDDGEAGAILEALAEVEAAGHGALPDGEDVHEAIESAVVEHVGAAGGKMHTARSRNDEVATCIRHALREDVLEAVEATLVLREALAEVAAAESETVMPGFTHLQPAQPTTVAHWALSYERAVARDTARLLDAYGRVNQSPLGAAAFAGTPFDVDRERTADLLGFDGVVENATDAASARDFLVETVAALSVHATTLSGLAEDLVVFASRGYVELSDDYASTSSIMPQKKNPDTLELVRATAGQANAGLQGLLTTLKGLPRAYNRDLQRAHPHAFDAADAVTEATEVAAGAVLTADWPADRLAAAAGEGFSTATGVADLLAMAGLPFRTAHQVVAHAVERSETVERASGETASRAAEQSEAADGASGEERPASRADRSNDAPDYETIAAAAEELLDEPLSAYVEREAVEAALDPFESVASRDSPGGPAPAAVDDQLSIAADDRARDRAALDDRREALAAAEELLDEVVESYV